MKSVKPDKVLVSKLESGKPSLILEALNEIKISGNVAIIPYLFDVIARGENEIIAEEIYRIISDIKDKDAVPVIIESIKRLDFGPRTANVLAICWQSRLDFSPYLDDFVRYFMRSDYQAAVEVFSVIEESVYHAPVAKRQQCLKVLEKGIKGIQPEKKPLYTELLKVVKESLDLTIDSRKNTS